MSDIIIAYRTHDGPVQFVLDDDGDVSMFISQSHAEDYVRGNRLFQSGRAKFQVIALDEL